jgi:peptide-methionine (S)-S-oxide reductase
MNINEKMESITLGGGCFWCLEPLFEELKGVKQIVVGYAGGKKNNPSYEDVCSGSTGHAEVVQISFNQEEISLENILSVFFESHDPTTPNRQGADVGSQYRSIILYELDAQKAIIDQILLSFSNKNKFDKPVITQVQKLDQFFPAEDYHQQYFKKNPWAGYCQIVIKPKVDKFRKNFQELRK